MVNVSVRISLLVLIIFSIVSCAGPSRTGRDYTRNHSRAKTYRSNPSRQPASRTTSTASVTKNKMPVSEARQSLIDYAKKHLGTPYRYGGKDPSGFDCSGFTQYVYRTQGLTLPPNSSAQSKFGNRISPFRAKPGDLIIFEDRGRVQHVGMIVSATPGGVEMIHASSSQGVVIENVTQSSYWKKRMAFAVSVLGS